MNAMPLVRASMALIALAAFSMSHAAATHDLVLTEVSATQLDATLDGVAVAVTFNQNDSWSLSLPQLDATQLAAWYEEDGTTANVIEWFLTGSVRVFSDVPSDVAHCSTFITCLADGETYSFQARYQNGDFVRATFYDHRR